jgi:hypothetical protein
VFEVFGQNLVLKEIFILHNEAVSTVRPLDNMIVLLLFKDLIGLHNEVRDLLLSMQPLLNGQLLLLVAALGLLRRFRSLHFFLLQLDAILGLVLP